MRSGWTPSIVPGGRHETVYAVIDDGYLREIDVASADLETTIKDLISGQYDNPDRIIAFNADERWSLDASADIAAEIQRRYDLLYEDLPSYLQGFVDRHAGTDRQLTLRLVR